MNQLYLLKKIIPFLALFALLVLLSWELFYSKPRELPSALIGENIPSFTLPNLFPAQSSLTNKALASGHVVLLNVWATWCEACQYEHAMLMKISHEYHIPIYSIDYKDNTADAIHWLEKNGNPYLLTGDDKTGDVAIDLGVYGTPETFVVNPAGKIIYRHIGVIDQKVWDEILSPLIKT
ncbi:MAG: DsbE family thiol:disulfide interchange protein [Gammaproteobacteria bacterium]|nr:DsbE family thiol:disulfide interchange protein [Gammaproteobacteria bacterium]MCW5582328.1 DsbE family thiol:disulfide interchange protein [Gammaproteobacteria bacterium]